MFTLLLAITPDDIRRIGIPLGIIVGSILGGWAIARNRRAHMDMPQKVTSLGSHSGNDIRGSRSSIQSLVQLSCSLPFTGFSLPSTNSESSVRSLCPSFAARAEPSSGASAAICL